jgi:predicted component of type VI protein secretion system
LNKIAIALIALFSLSMILTGCASSQDAEKPTGEVKKAEGEAAQTQSNRGPAASIDR